MCKTSTSSEKGLLKTTGSPGSEIHVMEGVQAFRRALPTCTNEASIVSENGEDDEFTIDGYSSGDSGEPIMDSHLFQHSSPRPGTRQRQSLITLMLESEREQQATSDKRSSEGPRSNVQDTLATCDRGKVTAPLSPLTTRRSMITTELTDSLRFGLVQERQQGTFVTDTVFNHQHVLQDTLNLRQFPKKPYMKASEDVNAGSWNRYLMEEASRDQYHFRGW
ncbi:hypothetical protein HRG_012134 [Hirsutella rhossiliensis]